MNKSLAQKYPLNREFFNRSSVKVAKDLIGCLVIRYYKGRTLSGVIVETEAYAGETDPASHAYRGQTSRNAVMFGPPGFAYVYFIYGVHYCLNFVTGPPGEASAVLIRALEPLEGIEAMKTLRANSNLANLTSGPGKLCQALGISRHLNGADLFGPELNVFGYLNPRAGEVAAGPRIGIRNGNELLWRYCLTNSPFLSVKPKKKGSQKQD